MVSSFQSRIVALEVERNQVDQQVRALLVKPAGYKEISHRGGFFDFLDRKILSHFQSEEKDMWSSDYPAVFAHMSEHAKLNDYITSLWDDLESNDEDRDEIVEVTSRLLGNWLIRHVETFDRELEEHLRRRLHKGSGAHSSGLGR